MYLYYICIIGFYCDVYLILVFFIFLNLFVGRKYGFGVLFFLRGLNFRDTSFKFRRK